MISRILFHLFKKRFIELSTKEIFQNQKKPDYLAKTEFVFIDSNGKRYFRYLSGGDIPGVRWAKIVEYQYILLLGITPSEEDLLMDFIELSNNNKKDSQSQIGFAITEYRRRRKNIVIKEVMMDLMGCLLIREDQEKHDEVWDDNFENEKIKQFNKDIAAGGLADFFAKARLKDYIPYLDGIKQELPQLLESTGKLTTLMNQKLLTYTTDLMLLNSATK